MEPVSTLVCVLRACAGELQAPIPVKMHRRVESHPARTLLIMLPGAGDRVGTYARHGLVQTVRDGGWDVDMLEVDAHYGYYHSRTLTERMQQDVLAPNRDRYREIWLVGISLGGLGALLTARAHPEQLDGVILMSPYLGRRSTLASIHAAGGLAAWEPPADADDQHWDVGIWRMLERICERHDAGDPELHLLYGKQDFAASAHRLLAAGLPSTRVRTTRGGHSWSTWRRLWRALLAEAPPFSPRPAGADLEPRQVAQARVERGDVGAR